MNPVKEKVRHTIEGDAVVDVILRDGSTLRLRPPARDDAEALVRFFAELSDQSLYQRFHGHPIIDAHLVEPDLEPDWSKRGALLGSAAGDDGERVVALASYARLREREAAEVAFAVADGYRGRGIGTRLLEQLAARAAEQGIKRFVAEVMAENEPMLRVFSEAGFSVSRSLTGGVVEVTFPIDATADVRRPSRRARPYRRRRLAAAILRAAFGGGARRVAAARHDRWRALPQHRRSATSAGPAYPDQPQRRGRVWRSRPTGRSTRSLTRSIWPSSAFPRPPYSSRRESALRKGVRALIVISAGFAEVGAEGTERQRQLLALVRAHGARLIGPNCLGVASAATRLNATFASRQAPAGNIGFSSQSGALGLAMLEAAESRGLGLSAFVSIGNKADVSSNDLLEWWEDDPQTEVVLLYVESFGNPRKFAELARRVARSKPILAVKSGTTAIRRSRRQLAYSGPGRLRGGRRRALPPGRSHPRRLARGARRRRDTAIDAAGSSRPRRGGADQCRRTRDHVRRRLRGGSV